MPRRSPGALRSGPLHRGRLRCGPLHCGLVWLALLGGCAQDSAADAAALLAAHQASLAAVGAPASGVLAPRSSAPGAPAATRAAPTAPAPSPLTPPLATPPWQAGSLLGASPETVRAALGEPVLRRTEGPAQIWLYAGGGCQVDIVLYPEDAGPRVAHVQARAGGLAQRTEASCLRDIASQANQPRAAPRPQPRREAPSSLGQPLGMDV